MTIRLALVEDNEAFREGFAMLLRSLDGIELVAQAVSGEDALLTVARTQPDVLVMDLNLPGIDGIETTKRLVNSSPHIRVLVLSMLEDDASVLAAMRAGACGYLVKGASQAEIVRAIEAVAAGQAIFGPRVARRILDQAAKPAADPPFPNLTERERAILDHLARGEDNTAIARSLGIAPKTVRNHLSTIFAKLQVPDRSRAIIRAREAGLGG
jgi:DNA-binding NarL/FixJ family response regulator